MVCDVQEKAVNIYPNAYVVLRSPIHRGPKNLSNWVKGLDSSPEAEADRSADTLAQVG